MNNMVITGRLAKPPEQRKTKAGDKVCHLGVVSEVRSVGEKKALYFNCTVWGSLAGPCLDHLVQGQAVTIVGDFDFEEYEKRDGTKGFSLKINVKQIDFGAKPRGQEDDTRRTESDYQGGNRTQRPKDRQEDEQERLAREAARRERETYGDETGGDDDLPF